LRDGSYVAADAPPTPTDRLEMRGIARFEGNTIRLDGDRFESITIDLAAGPPTATPPPSHT
jgi:hypothetical protein